MSVEVLLGHSVQPAAPGSSWKEPAAQESQAVQPGRSQKKPGAHCLQKAAPEPELKLPGWHCSQLMLLLLKNLQAKEPTGQQDSSQGNTWLPQLAVRL